MSIGNDASHVKAAADLRQHAENQLQICTAEKQYPQSLEEIQKLFHELQVHQIELEMQNKELLQARDNLDRALVKFTNLFDFAPVGFFVLDINGEITAVNFAGVSLIGGVRTQLIGQPFILFVTEPDRSAFSDFLSMVRASPIKESCEARLLNKAHQTVTVQIEAMATASGQEFYLAIIDLTRLRLAENSLRESEERMFKLAEMAVDAIVMVDETGTVTYCNAAAVKMFCSSAAEIIGQDFHRLFTPERFACAQKKGMTRFREQGTGPLIGTWTEVVGLRKDGTEFPLELSVSTVNIKSQWHAIGIMRDVTNRKEIEVTLRHESTHDALTGLYNRAFFNEELERLSNSRMFPVSIVMADVNNLKTINDTLGHEAGDTLIRLAARVIASVFRTGDIVARIGGDEFAVLLPETDTAVSEEAVRRIRNCPEVTSGKVSIAFGIALAENKEQLTDALKLSDDRMYLDKSVQKWA